MFLDSNHPLGGKVSLHQTLLKHVWQIDIVETQEGLIGTKMVVCQARKKKDLSGMSETYSVTVFPYHNKSINLFSIKIIAAFLFF